MLNELAGRVVSATPAREDGVKDVDIATVLTLLKAAFAAYECLSKRPARAAAACTLPLAVRAGLRRVYREAGIAPSPRITAAFVRAARTITEHELAAAAAELKGN